jgi:hypothetical protein
MVVVGEKRALGPRRARRLAYNGGCGPNSRKQARLGAPHSMRATSALSSECTLCSLTETTYMKCIFACLEVTSSARDVERESYSTT